ncbi:MAG: hypothetical protein H6665_07870 [Ardenticatenaceae bacterium]|nr:hypothetical protein [Ardenticatenaceae bacterium]
MRYWREDELPIGQSNSRLLLEIPQTGERYGFTQAEALLMSLQQQLQAHIEGEEGGAHDNK